MQVHRATSRLHDKYIRTADILLDLNVSLAICKPHH